LFLIEAATSAAEDYTGIDIALTLNQLEFIRFDDSVIVIDEAPYKSIEKIVVVNDGQEFEIPENEFEVRNRYTDFIIYFKDTNGKSKVIKAEKLTVHFYTGYDVDEAPFSVTAAILIKVNDLYDLERTSYTIGANFRETAAFKNLLNGHVINRW